MKRRLHWILSCAFLSACTGTTTATYEEFVQTRFDLARAIDAAKVPMRRARALGMDTSAAERELATINAVRSRCADPGALKEMLDARDRAQELAAKLDRMVMDAEHAARTASIKRVTKQATAEATEAIKTAKAIVDEVRALGRATDLHQERLADAESLLRSGDYKHAKEMAEFVSGELRSVAVSARAVAAPAEIPGKAGELQEQHYSTLRELVVAWPEVFQGHPLTICQFRNRETGVCLVLQGRAVLRAPWMVSGLGAGLGKVGANRKLARDTFDLGIKELVRRTAQSFPNETEFEGVEFAVVVDLHVWEGMSSETTLVFRFPMAAIREYVDMKITRDQLFGRALIAVDGERIRP